MVALKMPRAIEILDATLRRLERGAHSHRPALCRRSRHSRPLRRRASGGTAAAHQAAHRCIAGVAARQARRRLRQVNPRGGDPLRALALGGSLPLPRRRPHRDRLQRRRARNPSDRDDAFIVHPSLKCL
jgi:hypothetical protein